MRDGICKGHDVGVGGQAAAALDAGEWDMTLFTCNLDMTRRVLVRLTEAARLAEQGKTPVFAAVDGISVAIFAIADQARPGAKEAIALLHRLGLKTVMATGDLDAVANHVAREVGIDRVIARATPGDKLAVIRQLQAAGEKVGMIGDGINDAPALAQADIGFAMGGAGTDTAMEAADIAVMNDDLRRIPETIRLSKRTHNILWQNITLALGIKVIFMGLALFGNATMWMAVFADMGASLLVVFNGLRLLRSSEPSGQSLH